MDTEICQGFLVSGLSSGLKNTGQKDLGLIFSSVPATSAGVFTKNQVKAAPVVVDMERIKSGVCQALIANSGNANCCTGEQGMKDALTMTRLTADHLKIPDENVLVASTGVIGMMLDMPKIKRSIPELVAQLDKKGILDFTEAIMTTDTYPKLFSKTGHLKGQEFKVTGVAKGSGMIRPNMATMLCFVLTDIDISPELLKGAVFKGVENSFNKITIDGDMSTNDSVICLANGLSGVKIKNNSQLDHFQKILDDVLIRLAKELVKDGEGATKFIEIIVKNADSEENARKIVRTVANSNLVKTAFFGEDANWGRIIAAVGRSGVKIDPNCIEILFDDVTVVKKGIGAGLDAEAKATRVMKQREFSVTININNGVKSASLYTCDFSVDYVCINAEYRT